jgi:hypothetical protein
METPAGMQLIETAPKDGTRIVIWHDKRGLYAASWHDGDWWITTPRGRRSRKIPDKKVTHWKAL